MDAAELLLHKIRYQVLLLEVVNVQTLLCSLYCTKKGSTFLQSYCKCSFTVDDLTVGLLRLWFDSETTILCCGCRATMPTTQWCWWCPTPAAARSSAKEGRSSSMITYLHCLPVLMPNIFVLDCCACNEQCVICSPLHVVCTPEQVNVVFWYVLMYKFNVVFWYVLLSS